MIDLHCHVLPGIDDGAQDAEDAVGMARQADLDGIELICATPHIRHDHDVVLAELPARVDALNAELAERGSVARIVTGGEVAQGALDELSDAELRGVSLGGGGRWILLEPAPGPLSDPLASAVGKLGQRGFRAVVAHPERHVGPAFPERLAVLVGRGALIQVTAAMLEQRQTASAMLSLARSGLFHLLGSDAHSSRVGRPVRLSGAISALRAVDVMRPHLDWVASEAPRAILAGNEPEPPYPVTV